MKPEEYIDIALALAVLLSIWFPLQGVLTAHFFKHRFKTAPNLKRVAIWCVVWMACISLLGLTFGWPNGLIRYSGESLHLLSVHREENQILTKDIQRTRGSGNRTRYWITLSTPDQVQIQVSKKYFESIAIDQSIPIAYTALPRVYWAVGDSFSIKKFANFLLCYAFLIFCSCGFLALAWLPNRSQ